MENIMWLKARRISVLRFLIIRWIVGEGVPNVAVETL